MDYPTSFWSHPDGHTVRVQYIAPAYWENTLMADIDLATQKVNVLYGSQVEDRHKIAKFTLEISTEGHSYRKLSRTGNDAQILKDVLDVLEGFGNEYRLLKIHVKAVLDYDYRYTDASYLPLDEIRKQIMDAYAAEAGGVAKKQFCCGTTNDLDIRMEWHRIHDCEIVENKVYAWVCPLVQNAEIIKQWAADSGFHVNDDKALSMEETRKATIVYLFKMDIVSH